MTYISRFDFEAAIRAAIPATVDFHPQARDSTFLVPDLKTAKRMAKLSRGIRTSPNESWDCDDSAEELALKIRKKHRRNDPKPPAICYIYANKPIMHAWVLVLVEEPEGAFTLYYLQPGSTTLNLPGSIGMSQMYFAHL